jgi:hypothetical protein
MGYVRILNIVTQLTPPEAPIALLCSKYALTDPRRYRSLSEKLYLNRIQNEKSREEGEDKKRRKGS